MPPNSEIDKLERRWKENPKGTVFAPYAEALRKNGEPLLARDVLRQGLELHPDHIPGNIVLGRCCLDLREDGPAEAAFTHVLDLDPENVIALKALADVTERQGRLMEARGWLARLMTVDPSNDEARDQLERVDAAREAAAAVLTEQVTTAAPAAAAVVEETTATVEVVARPFVPQPGAMVETGTGEVADESADLDAEVGAAFGAYDPPPASEPRTPTREIEPPTRTREMEPPVPTREIEPLTAAGAMPDLDPEKTAPPMRAFSAPAPMPDLEPAELDLTEAARDLAPEPMAGIEPDEPFAPPVEPLPAPEPFSFGLEAPHDLELRPSGMSEFQAPDASEDLLEMAAGSSEFQMPDASQELGLAGSSSSEYQTPSGAEELLQRLSQSTEPVPAFEPELEPEPEPEPELEPVIDFAPPPPPPPMPAGPVTTGFAAISLMPTEELSTSPMADDEEPPVEPAKASLPGPEELPGPEPVVAAMAEPDVEPEPEPEASVVEEVATVSVIEELVAAGEAPDAPPAMEPEVEEAVAERAPRPSELKLIFPEEADAEPEPTPVRRISQEVQQAAEPAPVTAEPAAEPEPVLTESMAELYARQGHVAEALNVYRTLLARQPNDARLASRVRELEQQRSAGARRMSYVAVDTGGESVESFFRGLADARPGGPGAPDDGSGKPTRPARDPLSLSAIFGEEPAAQPAPKTTEPTPRAGGGGDPFSFDQFFGGPAPGPSTTGPRQAMPSDEDLDQFQHWLKSLKR